MGSQRACVRRQQQQASAGAALVRSLSLAPFFDDGIEEDGAGRKEAAGRAVAVPGPTGSFEHDAMQLCSGPQSLSPRAHARRNEENEDPAKITYSISAFFERPCNSCGRERKSSQVNTCRLAVSPFAVASSTTRAVHGFELPRSHLSSIRPRRGTRGGCCQKQTSRPPGLGGTRPGGRLPARCCTAVIAMRMSHSGNTISGTHRRRIERSK